MAQRWPATVTTAAAQREIYADADLEREMLRCAVSFKYFLKNHVYIADRLPNSDVAGVLQWEWWPLHDEICDDLVGSRNPVRQRVERLVVLKSRQIGWSWILAALHLHDAMFQDEYLGGTSSIGKDEAAEMLDKCRFIYDHLPWATKPVLSAGNTEELRFASTNGAIYAYASTPNAGKSYTFSRFTADEAAFHPYGKVNYNSYAPATEYGQIVIVSSAGGDDENRHVADIWFEQMWKGAKRGDNGFTARFYGRHVRPGRDAKWEERTRQRYSSNPGSFEKQYPQTPEEAFHSMLLLRFDQQSIDQGHELARIVPPIPLSGISLPENINRTLLAQAQLKIWALPSPGLTCCAYIEAAEGKGLDFTTSGIMAVGEIPRELVSLRDNRLEPGEHAAILIELAKWYNVKLLGFERNRGEAISHAIGKLWPWADRLYWNREQTPTRQQAGVGGSEPTYRLGLPVTGQTRRGLIDDLAQAVKDRQIIIYDPDFWGEADTFVVGEDGRAEALQASHDDVVMKMVGLLRMCQFTNLPRPNVAVEKTYSWAGGEASDGSKPWRNVG